MNIIPFCQGSRSAYERAYPDLQKRRLHTKPQPPEIDIKVLSADDAARRIESAGGKIIVPPFDIRIVHCAVVEDPWGNQFVILDNTKGLLATDSEGNVIGNFRIERPDPRGKKLDIGTLWSIKKHLALTYSRKFL